MVRGRSDVSQVGLVNAWLGYEGHLGNFDGIKTWSSIPI